MKMPSSHKSQPSLFSSFFIRSWMVWGCAALFYGYQFMLRVSPGVMAHELMKDFQVEACALGALTGFYYYAYSALQIPIGSLMDRFKPRRILTCAALFCTVGCILFGSAETVTQAAIGRALIGAGSAAAFLSCLKLSTIWFPQHFLPTILGMTLLLGTTGAITAGTPTAWLIDFSGWRTALFIAAGLGVIIAVLGWLIVRDHPSKTLAQALNHHQNEIEDKNSILQNIKTILKNKQSWLIAFYGGLMYVPLAGFADIWGAPFLSSVYGYNTATAGAGIAVFYTGLGLGSPFYPLLCKQLKSFKKTIFISAICPLVTFTWLIYFPCPAWLLFLLLFLSGALLSGQFLAFAMTCAINPLSASATAGGFHNMICMLSGVIFQPFIGWLLQASWTGKYNGCVPAYNIYEYSIALSTIPLSLFAASLVTFFLKETYQDVA